MIDNVSMKRISTIALAVLTMLMSIVAMLTLLDAAAFASGSADIVCVVPRGTIDGPYSECDAVFDNIQTAVDAVAVSGTIRVAAGVYTGVHQRNSVTQSVYISKPLAIIGGYQPPFDVPPNPILFPSIVDAEGLGRVIMIESADHVLLSGLTLINGDATYLKGDPYDTTMLLNDYGGGIFARSSTQLVIENCHISDNIANRNSLQDGFSSPRGYGGGIAIFESTAEIRDCSIEDNLASRYLRGTGGGIYAYGSELTLARNAILSNAALLYPTMAPSLGVGGGIATFRTIFTISENIINYNNALRGTSSSVEERFGGGHGGGLYLWDSHGAIINNDIEYNIASIQRFGEGGGLVFNSSAYWLNSRFILVGNRIRYNVASKTYNSAFRIIGHAGGLKVYGGVLGVLKVEIESNTIEGNVAITDGGLGRVGGILIDLGLPSFLKFTNNSVTNNIANGSGNGLYGGALIDTQDITETNYVVITDNYFGYNIATTSGITTSEVGGVRIDARAPIVANNIVEHNMVNGPFATVGGMSLRSVAAIFYNNVIIDNHADSAAPGLEIENFRRWSADLQIRILNSTIARNSGGFGTGIWIPENQVSEVGWELNITNTIIADQAIGISATDYVTVSVNSILWHDVITSILANGSSSYSLTNEFVGDPNFAFDGYHIGQGAAVDNGVGTAFPFDIDGQPRIGLQDLGADELWLGLFRLPAILFDSDVSE